MEKLQFAFQASILLLRLMYIKCVSLHISGVADEHFTGKI